MMIYLLKSGICLAIIWLVYRFVLENEKMPHFKRFFLLFGLLFSLVVPFLPVAGVWEPMLLEDLTTSSSSLIELSQASDQLEQPLLSWALFGQMAGSLYWLVTAILLLRFSYRLFQLLAKTWQHKIVPFRGATLVLLKESTLPYTFLQYIFVSSNAYQNEQIEEELFVHELTHARQWHSIDILLIELIQAFLWIHPLLPFFKQAIQLNHEFLADDEVIKAQYPVSAYQHLLLDKAAPSSEVYLSSNLNYLLTKKRLIMMTQNTSRSKAYSLAALSVPFFFALLFLFGQPAIGQENTTTTESKEIKALKDRYFKDATFICKSKSKGSVYKTYQALSPKEKAALPPPPPAPPGGTDKLIPLTSGTVVHLSDDGMVRLNGSGEDLPPPPPPPAPPAAPKPPAAPQPPTPVVGAAPAPPAAPKPPKPVAAPKAPKPPLPAAPKSKAFE